MSNESIVAICGLFIAILTFFIGFRKAKADAKIAEISAVQSVISIYKTLADDLEKKVIELSAEIDKFRKENNELKLEVAELKKLVGRGKQFK